MSRSTDRLDTAKNKYEKARLALQAMMVFALLVTEITIVTLLIRVNQISEDDKHAAEIARARSEEIHGCLVELIYDVIDPARDRNIPPDNPCPIPLVSEELTQVPH